MTGANLPIRDLLEWYARNRRQLPWRDDPSPYRVWVSEIMLQQTRVDTVCPYFERFIARFPALEALAGADLTDVLKAWEGLGYYSRARNLHRAAGELVQEGRGIPADFDALGKLPGIGRYTAAAVASIAFGKPFPVVDGNVLRVFARFFAIDADVTSAAVKNRAFRELSGAVAESGDPSAFNQAMMELGALVCSPRGPKCADCPLARDCRALREERTDELPVRRKRAPVPHYRIAVGLVEREGRILIARRPEEAMLGGLWEFPGGKVEPGETPDEAAVREIREETGLTVRVDRALCTVTHAYSHFRITLTAFRCVPTDARAPVRCEQPHAWVLPEEFPRYPFPKANHKIFREMGIPGY